jgi:hypothetical protein
MNIIFPYFWGKFSCTCNFSNIDGNDITLLNQEDLPANNLITVGPFNTTAEEKAALAVPKSLGNQTEVVFINARDLTTSTDYTIVPLGGDPTAIWNRGTVSNVVVNGIGHTYSLYLFSKGSETTAQWRFNQ